MNDNQLTTINQNSELVLIKSKNLLDITKKILDKKELIQTFPFKPFIVLSIFVLIYLLLYGKLVSDET